MPRVYIRFGYRGAPTNEVFLPVGENEVTPELADYLITNGHALPVEVAPPPEPPPPVEPEAPDYDAFTLPELRALAETKGIAHKRLSRADLIALLREG